DWLTAALRTRAPGVTVEDFAIADVVYATSTSVRLDLKLDEAGRRAGIPDSVFVKGGFQTHGRELIFMHRLETLGYRELLPGSALNAPRCYFAEYDDERAQAIVILEDL